MRAHRTETRARARALQLLYAREATGRPVETLMGGIFRLLRPDLAMLDQAERLATGVVSDLLAIDRVCAEASDHWRLDRLGVVERNILRLGVHELRVGTVPPRVVIDEALHLAHRFGGRASAAFVNGVLDRAARILGRL